MATFSYAEYADILFIYGFSNGNAAEAQREYVRRFPNRRIPHVSVFGATYRRISESGSLQRVECVGAPPADVNIDGEILRLLEEGPTTSTRKISRQLGVSQWKVWSVIHQNGLHPFHHTPVQGLDEGDPARRVQFCRFILHADIEDASFLTRILWTDESKFSREGITNFHNLHYWAEDNPHQKKQVSFQRKFSVNVWMGVIANNLIGPHFLPDNLNGENYEEFLRNNLYELLENVPLANRQEMIFQHDGCPAHYRLTIRELLEQRFPNRWIGRGGPIPWPARSPDLTPLDFYVWGHLKEIVYATEVNTREELIERIQNGVAILRQNFSNRVTRTEVRRRARDCIRNGGSHFEN
nr:DUF4817 domain-containing protein [Rickettsia endosymbiont of Ceutorhynchus assimilis]